VFEQGMLPGAPALPPPALPDVAPLPGLLPAMPSTLPDPAPIPLAPELTPVLPPLLRSLLTSQTAMPPHADDKLQQSQTHAAGECPRTKYPEPKEARNLRIDDMNELFFAKPNACVPRRHQRVPEPCVSEARLGFPELEAMSIQSLRHRRVDALERVDARSGCWRQR
jgi:hypothetical protein